MSLIACTGYFEALEEAYAGDVLILNVVFLPRRDDSHLVARLSPETQVLRLTVF